MKMVRCVNHPWQAWILTLLPELFPGPLQGGVVGRALVRGDWRLNVNDIRAFALDANCCVDGTPAGGGPGMVIRADVLGAAIDSVSPLMPNGGIFLCMSARGERLTQERVRELAKTPGLALVCGRFEGIDQRVLDARSVEEVSIGDFVLAGGEISAMAVIEACVRLLPGVMGNNASREEESFENGLLEYPQYTRPRVWEGREIPEELLSGDHKRIRRWRRLQSEVATRTRRPDLWQRWNGKTAEKQDENRLQ